MLLAYLPLPLSFAVLGINFSPVSTATVTPKALASRSNVAGWGQKCTFSMFRSVS
jgi:hypothetical protein